MAHVIIILKPGNQYYDVKTAIIDTLQHYLINMEDINFVFIK